MDKIYPNFSLTPFQKNLKFNSTKFVLINGPLLTIAFIQYYVLNSYRNLNPIFLYILTVLLFLSRNYAFLLFYFYEETKTTVHNMFIENYYDINAHVVSSSLTEALSFVYITKNYPFVETNSLGYDLLLFIPVSFLFEIIFDFFHYWFHRIIHSNTFLYIHLHKKHHKYIKPSALATFYLEPLDLLITMLIPVHLTLLIIPTISFYQLNNLLFYKLNIEICGHSEKDFKSGSFPQCILLPQLFDITLYTKCHHLHHSLNKCNYGKRFSLWDKVFGTYRSTSEKNCSKNNKNIIKTIQNEI